MQSFFICLVAMIRVTIGDSSLLFNCMYGAISTPDMETPSKNLSGELDNSLSPKLLMCLQSSTRLCCNLCVYHSQMGPGGVVCFDRPVLLDGRFLSRSGCLDEFMVRKDGQ